MAAMQDELGPKSVTVLVTWVDGQVHFEVGVTAGRPPVRVVWHVGAVLVVFVGSYTLCGMFDSRVPGMSGVLGWAGLGSSGCLL